MRKLYRLFRRSPFLRTFGLLIIMVIAVEQTSQRYAHSNTSLPSTSLFPIDPGAVTSLAIATPAGETYDLSYIRDGNQWFVVSDNQTLAIPRDSVEPFFSALGSLSAANVRTNIKKMEEYGVSDAAPMMKITVASPAEPAREVFLGSVHSDPSTRQYMTCLRFPKEPVVYMVRGNLPALFKKRFDDYKNPLVLNFDPDSVVELIYSKPGDSAVTFVKSNQTWSIKGNKTPVIQKALETELRRNAHLESRHFCKPALLAGNPQIANQLSIVKKDGMDTIGINIFKNNSVVIFHSTQNPKTYFQIDSLPNFFLESAAFIMAREKNVSGKTTVKFRSL